jgi:hypothetical protein
MRLLVATLSIATFALATAADAQQRPAAGAATAAGSATASDARCLLGMVALSNSQEPNAQHLGQGGVVYFMGRISAREPNYDFNRLRAMATTMNGQSVQTDLQQHCVPTFRASMERLEAALTPPASAKPPAATPPASPAPK